MPETRSDLTSRETADTGPGRTTVTVRYWAAARAAAGRVEDSVADVTTVQQVLDAVLARRAGDARFERVLAISSVLVGDQPVRRDAFQTVRVSAGDVVEILPPFAGG